MGEPLIAVAFIRPSDDWLSRLCGWWCGSQSKEDKTFGCSHCSLIIDDDVYEWRVGGLEVAKFRDWARDVGAYNIRHWVSIKHLDPEYVDRLHTVLYTLGTVNGPTYWDFLRFAIGKPGGLLCTGFIRLCLGGGVYNTTPLHLYKELVQWQNENDALSVQHRETIPMGITLQDTPTAQPSAMPVDTTNHLQTESNTQSLENLS